MNTPIPMEQQRPRGRRPGKSNTREKILDEAEYVIATRGPDGFTLQEVADRVGIRAPSIFSHFKGTAAITEAVFLRILEGATDSISVPQEASPKNMLLAIAASFARFMGSNPAHTRLMLQQFAGATDQIRAFQKFDSGVETIQMLYRNLAQLIDAGVKAGEIRKGVDPQELAATAAGAVLIRLAWTDFSGWDQPEWNKKLDVMVDDITHLLNGYLQP